MTRKVPFLDLRVTDPQLLQQLLGAVETVLRHGRLVMGPEVAEFEASLSRNLDGRLVAGVGSGTDALLLGLKGLGIGAGDEVITTSLSWIATANAIALTGATPVFADIRDDLNLDPASVERLVTSRTRAILAVHYTGKIADMTALNELAQAKSLLVVEDAAQAYGASLHGKPAGAWGDIGCFSMNPMKVLAAYGEAGAIATESEDVYQKLLALRYNGTVNREFCIEPSLNGRLDTIQAALLQIQLGRLDAIIARRRAIAARYAELLAGCVEVPVESSGQRDVYYTYTIKADQRDRLMEYLTAQGIETKIQHPILMPDQQPYSTASNDGYPMARQLAGRILCIPANEKLSDADVDYVALHIRTYYGANSS